MFAALKQLMPRTGVRYWQKRAAVHGKRAVYDLRQPPDELDRVTKEQIAQLFPPLKSLLRGDERAVLDFGCGPGRFTCQLADLIRGRAIGVDPIKTFLDLAPRAHNVEYRLISKKTIPLPDATVDVIWSCIVLGTIQTKKIAGTVRELKRVLKTGGLIYLVENTTPGRQNLPQMTYRSIAEYQSFFGALEHIGGYEDFGENISILAGRL
jgi:SAM-dependent methyltransferase